MTKTEQRIALCEWMGWGMDACGHNSDFPFRVRSPSGGVTAYATERQAIEVGYPDTSSLDVLHEMVLKLDEKQAMEFCFNLQRVVCGGFSIITGPLVVNATAAQRREALLRTLNLWKE